MAESNENQAPQEAQQGGGEQPKSSDKSSAKQSGNKTLKIVLIIVAILVFLGLLGTAAGIYFGRKAGEKIAEGILSAGSNSNVDIDSSSQTTTISDENGTVEISEANKWPEDLPGGFPKYSYGEVAYSGKNIDNEAGTMWSVTVNGSTLANYQSYLGQVASAGWAMSSSNSASGFSNSLYTKDGYSATISYDSSGSEFNLVISEDYVPQ